MTAAAAIKQADLTRIFKSAAEAKVNVRIELEPGGRTIITAGPGVESPATSQPEGNPLDRLLGK